MPLYVYKCNNCHHTFEQYQRITDEPLKECPACPDGVVRRVINQVSVVFKGSGFYITDSRKGNGHLNGAARPDKPGKDGEKVEKSTTTEKSGAAESSKQSTAISDQ